eukprot:1954682-Heterocapsa_arctica.AAC.1
MSHVVLLPLLDNGHLRLGHALARDLEVGFLVMVVVHVVVDRVVVADVLLTQNIQLGLKVVIDVILVD